MFHNNHPFIFSQLYEKRFTSVEIVGKLLLSLLSYEFISVFIRERGLTHAGFAIKHSTEAITGKSTNRDTSAKDRYFDTTIALLKPFPFSFECKKSMTKLLQKLKKILE